MTFASNDHRVVVKRADCYKQLAPQRIKHYISLKL